MLRALVGLASCLVPGRRRADKRKRDEDILDEALASRTTPPAGGGDAPPAAKRAAVERQPASQGQHQLQNGGMEQCFNTSATPGTSGGKRYGADLAGLQDFDSDGEQQHSSLQPRWEHAQDSHALKRKRPASAAAAGVLDGRPATPLAEAAAALRPTLERHPARANQQLAMQPRLQPEQRQSGAHLESKWADRILTGAAGRPPAAHQAVTGAPQAHPLPSFVKGQAVWYRQRDGTEEEAKVTSVDRTVEPPSYGVLLPGRSEARETVAERLRPWGPAESSCRAASDGWAQAAPAAPTAAARPSEGQAAS